MVRDIKRPEPRWDRWDPFPQKMEKRGGPGGGLLMVPCYVFYIHLKLINHLVRFKRVFLGSLVIVFVKVIIWVNCRLVHCWAGGRHFFHLKELALLVVIKFWGVGGSFVFFDFYLYNYLFLFYTLDNIFIVFHFLHFQISSIVLS